MNFFEMLKQQDGKKLALALEEKEYSYEQLVLLSEKKGKEIKEKCAGQPVVMIRENHILPQLLSFLGCQAVRKIPLILPADVTQLPEIPQVPPEACMAVMTSGSTGEPKVLFRKYESWADFFSTQNRIFGVTSHSRMFAQGSLAFTGNLNLYMAQFFAGAAMIATNVFDPRKWAMLIRKYETDLIYLIPRKLLLLPRCIPGEMPAVRHILAGSQSMGAREAGILKKSFPNAHILLYYGASELNYITYLENEQMSDVKNCIGKPFPGVDVEVKDGEIFVTTPYHVENVTCPYSLKDMGHMDENGYLFFDGRKDDIVNVRGRKVSLLRIENVLEEMEFVKEAMAFPVEIQGEQRVNVWITLWEEKSAKEETKILRTIRQNLVSRLANYELPYQCDIVSQLSHTESGKKDRRVLEWRKSY